MKWNEMKWRVVDERTNVPSYNTFDHVLGTVSSDVSIQEATGSRLQSIYKLPVLTLPMMGMMWSVKVNHKTGVYVPYSFRTVVWVLLRPTRTTQV